MVVHQRWPPRGPRESPREGDLAVGIDLGLQLGLVARDVVQQGEGYQAESGHDRGRFFGVEEMSYTAVRAEMSAWCNLGGQPPWRSALAIPQATSTAAFSVDESQLCRSPSQSTHAPYSVSSNPSSFSATGRGRVRPRSSPRRTGLVACARASVSFSCDRRCRFHGHLPVAVQRREIDSENDTAVSERPFGQGCCTPASVSASPVARTIVDTQTSSRREPAAIGPPLRGIPRTGSTGAIRPPTLLWEHAGADRRRPSVAAA